jgi:hypothetical protein
MKGFPLDNTEYEADALGAWLGVRTRGVFASDDHYPVTANGNMTVTLGPGLAWLKPDIYWGMVAFEPHATVMQIATADGALTRFAIICIRLDKNFNATSPIVKYGSYGTNPALSSIPLPERNIDFDEVYVAAIRVRAGATEILPSDITDLRLNETYCGLVRDGVERIPTQILEDEWRTWMDREQSDFEAWAANERNIFRQWSSNERKIFEDWSEAERKDYEVWSEAARITFEEWFANVKEVLDENTAGQLLLLIEDLRVKLGIVDPSPATVGAVSQLYVNTDTGTLFVCVNKEGLVHTWIRVGISGSVSSKASILGASFLGASYLM